MQALRDAGRAAALAAVVLVLAGTAWVCLIAGAVFLLARPFGPGLALLIVAGALLALVLLIALIAKATQPAPRPKSSLPPGLVAALLPQVMAGLARPAVMRAGLLVLGLLMAAAAVLVPGKGGDDGKPPAS